MNYKVILKSVFIIIVGSNSFAQDQDQLIKDLGKTYDAIENQLLNEGKKLNYEVSFHTGSKDQIMIIYFKTSDDKSWQWWFDRSKDMWNDNEYRCFQVSILINKSSSSDKKDIMEIKQQVEKTSLSGEIDEFLTPTNSSVENTYWVYRIDSNPMKFIYFDFGFSEEQWFYGVGTKYPNSYL